MTAPGRRTASPASAWLS